MTGRTAGAGVDVVAGNQRLLLAGPGWRPTHVDHVVLGANPSLGIAVTVDAPLHGERRDLLHGRHLVHTPVTGLAADALGDVDGVIEVHEVGEPVDPLPQDRSVGEVGPP